MFLVNCSKSRTESKRFYISRSIWFCSQNKYKENKSLEMEGYGAFLLISMRTNRGCLQLFSVRIKVCVLEITVMELVVEGAL